MEIAKRFKFFKRTQGMSEGTANFMAALRHLAKTCNFGQYLETALCDQFVCGLCDGICQQELVSKQDLTAAVVLQKATAAEAVSKETQTMRETTTATGGEVYKLLSKTKCYRCGKSGHHLSNCKFQSAKCYSCQKVGHLASVCQSKKPTITSERSQAATKAQGKPPTKAEGVCTLQEKSDSSSDSSKFEHLHTVFQLGIKAYKFVITVKSINRNGSRLGSRKIYSSIVSFSEEASRCM